MAGFAKITVSMRFFTTAFFILYTAYKVLNKKKPKECICSYGDCEDNTSAAVNRTMPENQVMSYQPNGPKNNKLQFDLNDGVVLMGYICFFMGIGRLISMLPISLSIFVLIFVYVVYNITSKSYVVNKSWFKGTISINGNVNKLKPSC